MKKFLSLVLALVMTMSLVTVSAGAKDFGDSDKIQYKEAVDVMSAVKVIDGYTDGSFNPTATLTRGAAAKIICNLILGPTTANALVADSAPYKDVPTNHTFAGYIAYCQKEGIISGYADGSFRPANSLTGYAFMKMLLGALGYDAKVEGYTGPNWSVNVAKRALNIGLTDDLIGNFNGVKAVNREEACLYALNTLQANMVEYDAKTSVSTGDTTVVITGSKAKDMENKNANTDGKVFNKDGVMQFAEKYFTDVTVQKGSDDFSRPANVWKIKAEEIGTYTDTADLTYTKAVKSCDIYKDLGLGKTMSKSDVNVYINGERVSAADLDLKKGSDDKVGKNYKAMGAKKYLDAAQNGVLTEVFYDKDAETVTISQIVTYVGEVQKTVAATDKKDAYITISTKELSTNLMSVPYNNDGNKVSSILEFETDEKFADETYVLYTCSFKDDSKGEVKSAAAAQKVEGYVTKTVNKTDDEDKNNGITIADTEYKMSCATTGEKLGDISVKNDYLAYLDQYGYVIYVEEIEEIGNYALVLQTAAKSDFVGKKAELLFTDGTTKVVTTEKNYNSGSNAIADNTIVTYKADADGVYTLKEVKTTSYNTSKALNMKNDKAGIVVNGKTIHANSATVFVVRDVKDHDDYTSYTGVKNAPTIQTPAAGTSDDMVSTYYYCKNGDMATVVFLFPGKKVNVEDDANAMLFLSQEDVSDLINDTEGNYFIYHAIINGEVKDVKVDKSLGNGLSGLYKSYSTNAKKTIITSLKNYTKYTDGDTKQYLAGTGLDKVSKEYTVILDTANGKQTITCDDNAKYYYVDKDGKITEINYNGINPDENDKVYAIVQDYMVKTLVIQEIEAGVAGDISEFKGDFFKANNIRINKNGFVKMDVEVTRPEFLDKTTTLGYTFEIWVNGSYYDTHTVAPAAGFAANDMTDKTSWNNNLVSGLYLMDPVSADDTIEIKNFEFTGETYIVKYVDKNNKEMDKSLFDSGDTVFKLKGDGTETLKFKLNSTKFAIGTYDWEVEGLSNTSGTSGKNVTIATGNSLSNAQVKDNLKNYVIVRIDTSKLASSKKYDVVSTIASDSDIFGAVKQTGASAVTVDKFGAKDLLGTAADKLMVEWDDAGSTGAVNLAEYTGVTFTATVTAGAKPNAYSYDVTVKTNIGDIVIEDVVSGTPGTKTIAMPAKDVEITGVTAKIHTDKLTVGEATVSGNKLTISFTTALSEGSGSKLGLGDFTNGTGTLTTTSNTLTSSGAKLVEDESKIDYATGTVTLFFDKAIVANDVVKLAASKACNAGNVADTVVETTFTVAANTDGSLKVNVTV